MGLSEAWRRANSRICPWWLCPAFDNPLRRLFHPPRPLLSPYVQPGMVAADIGCGRGYFTVALARLAGPRGRVIAVDLQPRMLAALARRARRAGVAERIQLHRGRPERLGVEGPVDFALLFWMAHEVPDKPRFLAEILAMLNGGGRLLLVEPKFHVTRGQFERTRALCREAGLIASAEPAVALSRAVVFGKG